MWWIQEFVEACRRFREAQQQEIGRLRRVYRESERLRAELSHLEHEIYGIQDSDLSWRQKALLEAAIRVRCRKVEDELLWRQGDLAASGHLVSHW